MSTTPLSHATHLLGALLLALATCTAQAQSYAPGRATRMNLAEGTVSLAPAGSDDWGPALFQRPLADGDRLHTAAGARAELHSGSTALRLQGPAVLELSEQTDTRTRLALTQGTLALRVRQLYPGETLEVNTPQLAFIPSQPGEYRLDVDARFGTTTVTLRSGQAVVYGENGAARNLASPQQLRFMDRLLGQELVRPNLQRDAFDLWSAARDRAEEAAPGSYQGEVYGPVYPQPRYAPYPAPYPIVVPFPMAPAPRFEPDRRHPAPPPDWNRPPRPTGPFGPPPTRIEPMVQPPPQPPMPMPRPEMRMHDAPRSQAELEQRAQLQRQQQIDRERQQQERNRQQMQAPQAPMQAPMLTRPMPRPQLLEPR